MKKTNRVAALLFAVTLLTAALAAPVSAGTSGEWDAPPLAVSVSQGETLEQTMTLTANEDLGDITFEVVPELAPYVSVSPGTAEDVLSGDAVVVTLTVSAALDAPLGVFNGTVKAKAEKKTLAKPLPVTVEITPFDPSVEAVIGTTGGTVTTDDGAASVSISAGSLSGDTVISIVPTDETTPADLGEQVGLVYDFGPDGTVFTRIARVTLAIPDGADTAGLVMVYQGSDGIWRSTPTAVDAASGTATGIALHFTRFALVRPQLPFEQPAPVVTPESGSSGTVFDLTASGFDAGEATEVVVVHPDETYSVMPSTADGSGGVVLGIDTEGYADGSRNAWVQATQGPGHTALATFEVAEPQPPEEIVVMDTTESVAVDGNVGTVDVPAIAQGIELPALSGSLTITVDLAVSADRPSDGLVISLHPDAGGQPDDSVTLATSSVVAADALPVFTEGTASVSVTLSGLDLAEGTYWVVISRTGTADSDQHYVIALSTDDPYGAGLVAVGDPAVSTWTTIPEIDLIARIVSP